MKSYLLPLALLSITAVSGHAQTALDATRLNQNDLKGTARFMGMAGAFGALGADLSTLSYNPAGIGVYRSSDIGATVDLDFQHATTDAQGLKNSENQTKFLLNNIGGVATLRLNSPSIPNLNIGFTYNKGVSFNRRYQGSFPRNGSSLSNYVAGIANASGTTQGDVTGGDGYEPYESDTPWLPILFYDSYLINPYNISETETEWSGVWGSGTSGSATYAVEEKGSVDEYNIALGGNVRNLVYWGMNFDIVNINYQRESVWAEYLNDAYLLDDTNRVQQMQSDWNLYNYYRVNGSGFKYSLGFIIKPIQEFRIGFAFHTPTWYSLTENYSADVKFRHGGMNQYDYAETNNGNTAYSDFNLRTPWRFIFSAAGVIGGRFILSADYELSPTSHMKYSQYTGGYNDGYWGDDWDWDWGYPFYAPVSRATYVNDNNFRNDPYFYQNEEIKEISQTRHSLRLGAEYRVTDNFSARVGYSFVSSPVKEVVHDNRYLMSTGINPSYSLDNTTNYVTCGLGYKFSGFYVDLAYVYKHQSADYHAYGPDPSQSQVVSPQSKLSLNNSQLILSCGFRF